MRILVDHREKSSGMFEELGNRFEIESGNLSSGDYLINLRILVERKTARDFVLSLVDTRLFRQVRRMKNQGFRSVLLVEGNPFETDLDVSPEAIKGALLSVAVIWQLPVIFSGSRTETAGIFESIGRLDEKRLDILPLRGGYRPKRIFSRQLYFLQGLPGVGPVTAKRLMARFGTPARALSASEKELISVRGIGKEKAALIRKVLNGPPSRKKGL